MIVQGQPAELELRLIVNGTPDSTRTWVTGDVKLKLPGGSVADADVSDIALVGNGIWLLTIDGTDTATTGKAIWWIDPTAIPGAMDFAQSTDIIPAWATASALATVGGGVDAIKAKTDLLPASPASTSDVTAATAPLATAAELADLALAVASIPTASPPSAEAIADEVETRTLDAHVLDLEEAAVATIQAGLATAASVAAIPTHPLLDDDARLDNLDAPISGIDTASLAAQLAAVPAAVWQRVLDSNAPVNARTAEQILNLLAARAYGPKIERADGSVTIRDPGDTKDRITGEAVNGVRTLTGADGS